MRVNSTSRSLSRGRPPRQSPGQSSRTEPLGNSKPDCRLGFIGVPSREQGLGPSAGAAQDRAIGPGDPPCPLAWRCNTDGDRRDHRLTRPLRGRERANRHRGPRGRGRGGNLARSRRAPAVIPLAAQRERGTAPDSPGRLSSNTLPRSPSRYTRSPPINRARWRETVNPRPIEAGCPTGPSP